MRLKSIKLAGFKSFVDPTTVHFPGNMSAVVGPNGCGKSNIIDAVRWVMGESSARHLRGESMTDVIFNGAVGRAPVSQASIELIFDNTAMTLPGEFARYNEISIRRKVTRDAQSFYYLNGNKCRRKDITDIFLGTGLGPRSYAIIEQGMISRLIESRPEELRVFIEEAAGISRYKERRKETESRIKRTRENLERLRDVRDELERQLQTLQKQARTAEKYREYKAEERERKAQLATLRWYTLDLAKQQDRNLLRAQELELERHLTERVRNDAQLERLREQRREQAVVVDESQAAFYRVGAEISGLEMQLKGLQDRRLQFQAERRQLMDQQMLLTGETTAEQDTMAALEAETAELAPELEEIRMAEEVSAERFENAEEAMQGWQQEWDLFAAQAAQIQNTAGIEQSQIQQIERSIQLASGQLEKLQEELLQLGFDDEPALLIHRERLAECELQLDVQQENLRAVQMRTLQCGQETESLNQRLHGVQASLQNLRGEQGAISALETSADINSGHALQDWLAGRGQSVVDKLVSQVSAEPAWETAIESMLGSRLQAGMVSGSIIEMLQFDLPEGIALVCQSPDVALQPFLQAAPRAIADWLAGAVAVTDKAEAAARLDELQPHEFFLLPCGTRIGSSWLISSPVRSPELGSLTRQKRLRQIVATLAECEEEIAAIEAEKLQRRRQVEENRRLENVIQEHLGELNRQIVHEKTRISAEEAKCEHYRQRREVVNREAELLRQRRQEESQHLRAIRESWQIAMQQLEHQADERDRLQEKREHLRNEMDSSRSRARQDRDRLHQVQLRLNSLTARREGLQQSLDKSLAALERLAARLAWVAESAVELGDPEEKLRLALEAALDLRLVSETRLNEARKALQQTDETLREQDLARLSVETGIQAVRQSVEQLRLSIRESELRQQTFLDQLAEYHATLQAVQESLPEGMSELRLSADIESLAARIERLGAINLAAIDEYAAQAQRKTYLDEQNADLEEALETLENAIRKIDRETRQKFKETYDLVNASLQALFPKVFGGGSATLELTGDDLLETGVTIMARPPGKKNSTIHLLSGGEKALTAIALVFSIFQLNPAPFCMLDEVDAPLDDANVGRYARMVKDMSEQVQFIYISHNKIAMEMADHLMGVTMHEPGVSRMVSVDVEEALALAGV
jgi:chromosome segregation protein